MMPQGAKPLTEADFERLIGIDREIVISANLSRVDNFTARQLTGQNGTYDLSGIAIPYYRPGTSEPLEYSVRLDEPPCTELGKSGEFKESRKYLWPTGRQNRFYIPPGIKKEWLEDTSIPVIFVEGVKKALALWGLAFHGVSDAVGKPRFVVIGLNGVWNWRTKTGREETADGGWEPITERLPDFAWVTWEKRSVLVLYDSNVRTNRDVRAARKELARELRSLDVAEVRYVDLPQIEGINGIDDLLGLWSKERVWALIEDEAYDSSSFALTDLGNAERFVYQHSENVRFCHELGKGGEWLTWTGLRWQVDKQKRSVELAKETVRSMKTETDRLYREAKPELERLQTELKSTPETDKEKRAEIQKKIETAAQRGPKMAAWQQRSEQKRSIFDMLTLAQSVPEVCVALGDLDRNHWLFNAANGTIDLSTGKLQKPRRGDLMTQMSPVRYDATATCPLWEKFLSEVFAGNKDLIPFIQTYVGYSLTGLTKEEYLVVLHGGGRNGKGTFIKTLSEMFGDYGMTTDFNTFVDKGENSRAPRDDVANMKGKRLVTSQETREGAKLAEALVKWLTGGDKLRARKLHENSSEMDPTWKILLATNHKPEISGDDIGIWSRIKLVPFIVSFVGREDKNLKENLMSELPGILRWAIEGCNTYMSKGLVFPQAVLDATSEYKKESDKLGQWLEECCVLNKGLQKWGFELYASYEKWCSRTHEETVLNSRSFGRRLSKHEDLTSKHGDKGTLYFGIGIKAAATESYGNS
ncbi:MAG: phage/plasmid primase, P4 family [Bryobacteraceae bacterium]